VIGIIPPVSERKVRLSQERAVPKSDIRDVRRLRNTEIEIIQKRTLARSIAHLNMERPHQSISDVNLTCETSEMVKSPSGDMDIKPKTKVKPRRSLDSKNENNNSPDINQIFGPHQIKNKELNPNNDFICVKAKKKTSAFV